MIDIIIYKNRVKGFGHDIFYIQGDENPLSN